VIKDRQSASYLNAWLSACCVVHNFVEEEDGTWDLGTSDEWESHQEPEPSHEEEVYAAMGNSRLSDQRRDDLFQTFLSNMT
jgi:hypothetical protein